MIRLFAALFALLVAAPLQAAVEIKEVKSEGGLTAWLVEEPSIPFVALEIIFKGGANLDPDGKRGVTSLMMALIEEGAGDMDARGFATAQEELAASFSFDARDDSVSVSAKFLTENRDEAIALLKTALSAPTFAPDAVERVRAQFLSIIRSDQTDPSKVASRAFEAATYGDHPYATAREGTIESMSALTREDLFAAHKGAMARDRVYVGAVGDITGPELAELMDTLLGDLPEEGLPQAQKATYLPETGGVTVIDFETPQATVIFGHEGIDRDDPEFFEAYVLNQALGGGNFSSRLMEEVREKRGLTYGVYSYLVPADLGALYLGSVASANDRVAEAIEVIRAEWAKAAEEGLTAEELERAKTYLTGAYPLRFDGNGRIANILVGMQAQGLPIDYIATRNDRVEAVTLEGIRKVAKRILRPDDLRFVVVGKPVGLTSSP